MVLSGKAVCLCIHLTFTATVSPGVEQGEYIHTLAALMAALVAGSQEALLLLKAQLTIAEELHIHQSAYSSRREKNELLKGISKISDYDPSYYWSSFFFNNKSHGHEITKTKGKYCQ